MNNQSIIFNYRIAAILCPAIAVGLFQVFLNKPAQATAGNTSVEFLALPAVPQWSVLDNQSEIVASDTASPFWFDESEMLVPELPFQQPTTVNIIKEPDPIFHLSAVLPSAANPLAVIDGKPLAEGDLVMEDWTLYKIVGDERYVVLMHSSGRRVRVQMSRN